jgi:preprotein translocase subunit SecA
MLGIAKKILGTENDRRLKKMRPMVDRINGLEDEFQKLTDDQLKLKTEEYKRRYNDGETLDKLLPEAFATVREAAKRTLGQRHYDVQLIGGICMHNGMIAEMRTGEGKTLVATLSAYLNAIPERGVHVVTVNDYLASRDADWMGKVYNFLGLTVGCIVAGLSDAERRAAYHCDITYGTNNEFGFDYLRDNMKYAVEDMAQRGHHYAIIDEIDSILIDEARTPLIISGPTDDKSELYRRVDTFIPLLSSEGYEIDEKSRQASFNEEGNEQIENILRENGLLEGNSLYDVENVTIVHHINQALKAHKIFHRDKDYIVKDDKVMLIDEFTGRMMDGRRLSDGLHQAIEAKEGVAIQSENVTLASVTYQNYFRLYEKLSGMTGTALTEASEFFEIYKLEVLEIPTNRPIQRIDDQDVIYRTEREKFDAIADEILECRLKGQPMLVGTASIEKSEALSRALNEKGIEHKVLNARYHDQEASIIAQAGRPGAVTIATNMAGRGTDIQLGGNLEFRIADEMPEGFSETQAERFREDIQAEIERDKQIALEAGGLYVLGTERHESRRIDNQLRGRTGRQGDPGRSKFYISTEDDLMRIFAGDRLKSMMDKMGWKEGESMGNRMMTKSVETAQKRVEARNFDQRKNVLKYDDVQNEQRKSIFEQRLEFMTDDDVSDVIEGLRHEVCENLIGQYVPRKAYAEQWDIEGLSQKSREVLAMELPFAEWAAEEGIADEEMLERMKGSVDQAYHQLTQGLDPNAVHRVQKQILLQVIDRNWREHLQQLDQLKGVIGLRGYGQRDPLNEYKTEAFTLFDNLLGDLREGVTQALNRLFINEAMRRQQEGQTAHKAAQQASVASGAPRSAVDAVRGSTTTSPEGNLAELSAEQLQGVKRNDACPCGSGKKFKHCHGQIT